MTAHAIIEHTDPFMRRIRIHLGENFGDGTGTIARFGLVDFEKVEAGAMAYPNPDEAPLVLREDHARAIYEALARHFGGAPDMTVLRRDYDAERQRVDRMIGALIAGREQIQRSTP